jgi:hypothetical protein
MKKKRAFNRLTRLNRQATATISVILCSFCSLAQNRQDVFAWQASLDTVAQAAFYRIGLTPALIAKCRLDLPDLRIADQAGKYIPYVLKSDLPILSTEGFHEFPILSNRRIKDSSTEIVIANKASSSLNYLLLVMQNSAARRTATLSGSDDGNKWYAIREHIGLEEAGNDTADHFVQSVSFPSSSYHYFKMILDDKGLLPLHILKTGMFSRSYKKGRYLEIPDPIIHQKDSSDRHSYITLLFGEAYRIDQLTLQMQGPALYKRNVRIFKEEPAASPQAVATGEGLVTEITLDPSNTSIHFLPVKTSRLLIDISNEDNMPLSVQKVASYQLDQYLLAYLQPGVAYRLLAGNAVATTPEYDLKYFVDTVGSDPKQVLAGPLRPVDHPTMANSLAAKDHAAIILWAIIAGVLLLLIFLSVKMLKAIPKKNEQDRL